MSLSLSAHERCGPPSSCNVPYIPPFFSFFFSLSFPFILMCIPRTTSVQRTLHLYLRVEGSFSAMDTGIGRRPAVKFILLTWAATMILLLSRFSTADLYYRSGPGLYSPRNANLLYRVIRPCADRCISLSLSLFFSLSFSIPNREPAPGRWIDRWNRWWAGSILLDLVARLVVARCF